MHTRTLILASALLVACGGKEEPEPTETDSPTETGTPPTTETGTPPTTETGTPTETGAPTETGTPGVDRDGTYDGTFDVEVRDVGFVETVDTCSGPLQIVIDQSASPHVTGTGTCTFSGGLAGQTVTVSFQGDVSDDEVNGNHKVQYLWADQGTSWFGMFWSDTELKSSFSGSASQGSGSVIWSGSFTVEKP